MDPAQTFVQLHSEPNCGGHGKIVENAVLPLQIWVDNQGIADGWHRDRSWCTAAARPAADLRKRIWDLIDDIVSDGLEISKCSPACTLARPCVQLRLLLWQQQLAPEHVRVTNDIFASNGVLLDGLGTQQQVRVRGPLLVIIVCDTFAAPSDPFLVIFSS